eukprot:TRINITY_DN12031_c0_g1_i2.p1 TRINITY_DN12031_c0_g1~~TRINITY_DN12031_c0_g1_i2.p1  ORF type:complete len:224 (-),score=38.80 TRINITY_DN12031_c0_g1_i2:13-684(-)
MSSQVGACRFERTKLLLHDEWKALAVGMSFEDAACEEVLDHPSVVPRVTDSQPEESNASRDHISWHVVDSAEKHDLQPAQRVHCSHVGELVALRNRNRNRVSLNAAAANSDSGERKSICPRVNCLDEEEWEAIFRRMNLHSAARQHIAAAEAAHEGASSDSGERKSICPRVNCLDEEEWEAIFRRMNLHSAARQHIAAAEAAHEGASDSTGSAARGGHSSQEW